MSAKHTPTPWRVGRPGTVVSDSHIEHGPGGCDCVEYYGGHLIAESITSANSRRIVACVNACEGISTESLERSDVIASMQGERRRLETQRDDLLTALHRLLCAADAQAITLDERAAARAAIAKAEGAGK